MRLQIPAEWWTSPPRPNRCISGQSLFAKSSIYDMLIKYPIGPGKILLLPRIIIYGLDRLFDGFANGAMYYVEFYMNKTLLWSNIPVRNICLYQPYYINSFLVINQSYLLAPIPFPQDLRLVGDEEGIFTIHAWVEETCLWDIDGLLLWDGWICDDPRRKS